MTTPTLSHTNYIQCKKISDIMCSTIHPSLLARIPEEGKHVRAPWLLLEVLQKIARPFRSMNLPPEPRECVYDFVPELSAKQIRCATKPHFPALTRVCSTLRNETLPRSLQNTTFNVAEVSDSLSRRERLRQLRDWTDTVGENIQHLRSMSLRLQCNAELEIRYSITSGIVIEFRNRHRRGLACTSAALERLDTLIAKTELLDLQSCSGKVVMATALEIVEIMATGVRRGY